jgi:hypothetical protein
MWEQVMNWLKRIFSGGATELVSKIGDAVGRVSEAHLGKKELKLELAKLVNAQFDATAEIAVAELGAKERVLVAELQQGDKFTKRARPMVVYSGLVIIFLDISARYISHFGENPIPETMVPTEFWVAWGGVVGTWVIGRTAEKVGIRKKLVGAVTGNGKAPSLLDD